MPLPEPKDNEPEDEFVSRCMSDDVMKKEFPKHKQRSAVCYKQYEKKNEENKMDILKKIDNYLNEANTDYGVKWREFDKRDRLTTKEKFFKNKKSYEKFLEKLEDKDNFYEIIGTREPGDFK